MNGCLMLGSAQLRLNVVLWVMSTPPMGLEKRMAVPQYVVVDPSSGSLVYHPWQKA
jgi:hypothetical protein